MTHALVIIKMHAVASAILLFTLNIIGMGLGPFLIGVFKEPDRAFGQKQCDLIPVRALYLSFW